MTVVCPRLNPFASNPIVITSLNQYELRLSTYDRVPGTKVTLSCVDDLEVQGQSVISCQEDGYWNFESRPFCAKPSLYGAPTVDDPVNSDLPESAKILIGVMVAVTLIMTIIMIFISCLIRRKMRELQKHQKLREEISPSEDEDQRKRGLVFINNNPQTQQSLNDYDYTAVTSSDISVNESRNDVSVAAHLSKRESTNRFSPKPTTKPVNNGQKGRRHSEIIQRKNINHDTQNPSSNNDSARIFQSVNAGLREEVKKQNSRRQRSLSAAGFESVASTNPSPNSENVNHLRSSKNNQMNNVASIFAISGRSNGSLHRGSISLGEEDEHHTDLTEINTDAMSYGRDPFLWKSVPHDWNSH
ncbi:uncharacterized protein DDB_G0287625-like isoform X2 [Ostrea edulis]|uniref:uncharacterized protein DDB_G0287625-like isoform X2 n=1 Tax=Ostrea edulis TaxID=37623 RepID=UPI0024AF5721|nr:uncharacterized protein DDB_G0287625-like isoform X2 [Ostrea edulis]